MTLAEIIANVESNRGSQFDKYVLTGWINEIENKAYNQVINKAEGNDIEFAPYRYDLDAEKTLAIPDVHKDVYETYLYAKIDYTNNEIDAYNADASMHAAAWDDYAAEYRRSHMPKEMKPKHDCNLTIHLI